MVQAEGKSLQGLLAWELDKALGGCALSTLRDRFRQPFAGLAAESRSPPARTRTPSKALAVHAQCSS